MQPYLHDSFETGVTDYEVGSDYIKVRFRGGKVYVYSYGSAGAEHIERMKELARAGRGLSTYISQHTRDLYER